ncbi:hypothetical protein [Streptomyces sp. MST-110588]
MVTVPRRWAKGRQVLSHPSQPGRTSPDS